MKSLKNELANGPADGWFRNGGILLSGPAGAGKSQRAQQIRRERPGPTVVSDFQSLYASVLQIERQANGRYPERKLPDDFVIPLIEELRRDLVEAAIQREIFVIATNSDGSPDKRAGLLSLLGPGSAETVLDPGITVVESRLSVDGELSDNCKNAINRWYGRL